jgi:hypothetical protein
MGILTRVTGTDLLIRTLMVMTLDNESLITPKRVRVFPFQEGLYHGHSYPGDLGKCSYLPSNRSFKVIEVFTHRTWSRQGFNIFKLKK